MAHFLRGSWTIFLPFRHIELLVRTFFLGFLTVATWEWADVLFDGFITQVRPFAFLPSQVALTLRRSL
jgi:nucleoporin NDC1